jgi:hypothetical protein
MLLHRHQIYCSFYLLDMSIFMFILMIEQLQCLYILLKFVDLFLPDTRKLHMISPVCIIFCCINTGTHVWAGLFLLVCCL